VNAAAKELTQSLRSESGVDLELADSIWFDTGIQLKPDFVSANKDFYQSELSSVNFETPEAADTINKWADKSTHGKITDIVSFPFPAATQMILASAIYFKAKWTEPFDADLTQPRNFYLSDGVVKMTQMMSQHKSFRYRESPDFQEIILPYAGGQLQMTLFLPATNSSPQKLLAHFTGAHWAHELSAGPSLREGTVILPKFKISYNIVLNSSLEALGMQQAFIPGAANFSDITGESLNVSEVAQKSYINVDEEGTEAAAITTVWAVNSMAMRGPPPFQMVINRPFLFMISDGTTGTILFAGVINDPTLH
jgi:serpin B